MVVLTLIIFSITLSSLLSYSSSLSLSLSSFSSSLSLSRLFWLTSSSSTLSSPSHLPPSHYVVQFLNITCSSIFKFFKTWFPFHITGALLVTLNRNKNKTYLENAKLITPLCMQIDYSNRNIHDFSLNLCACVRYSTRYLWKEILFDNLQYVLMVNCSVGNDLWKSFLKNVMMEFCLLVFVQFGAICFFKGNYGNYIFIFNFYLFIFWGFQGERWLLLRDFEGN